MFQPVHLLPMFDSDKLKSYRERWEQGDGPSLRDKILAMIREGAGEDFLESEFERHHLGFLENMWDLQGINIYDEDLKFQGEGSGWFESIDFSYAQFYHSKFQGAEFAPSTFYFARIYNCKFTNCSFSFSDFYGAMFEKVKFKDCNFIQNNTFTNCDFRDVEFANCFMPESIFRDCRFDPDTVISDPISNAHHGWNLTFDNKQLATFYRDLKEGFSAGGVTRQTKRYFFRQSQATTRHNSVGFRQIFAGYLLEYLTGYGVRPLRVLSALALLLIITTTIYSGAVGFENALILAAGGFFTFGGYFDLLKSLPLGYKVVFISSAFLGMFLTGLLVTVWANVWFKEW